MIGIDRARGNVACNNGFDLANGFERLALAKKATQAYARADMLGLPASGAINRHIAGVYLRKLSLDSTPSNSGRSGQLKLSLC